MAVRKNRIEQFSDTVEASGEAFDHQRRVTQSERQLRAIKDDMRELSETIARLTETTARYTKLRVETAAQTAVDRYPVSSIAIAALVGYWWAGRRRR